MFTQQLERMNELNLQTSVSVGKKVSENSV